MSEFVLDDKARRLVGSLDFRILLNQRADRLDIRYMEEDEGDGIDRDDHISKFVYDYHPDPSYAMDDAPDWTISFRDALSRVSFSVATQMANLTIDNPKVVFDYPHGPNPITQFRIDWRAITGRRMTPPNALPVTPEDLVLDPGAYDSGAHWDKAYARALERQVQETVEFISKGIE